MIMLLPAGHRDLHSDLLLPIPSKVRNTLHWTCTWIKNISSRALAGWDVSHIHDVLTLSEHPKKLSQLSSLTMFFLHHSQKAESLTHSSGPDCLKNHLLLLKCQLRFDAFTIMPETSFCRMFRVEFLKKVTVPSRTRFTGCFTSYNTKFMTQPH